MAHRRIVLDQPTYPVRHHLRPDILLGQGLLYSQTNLFQAGRVSGFISQSRHALAVSIDSSGSSH